MWWAGPYIPSSLLSMSYFVTVSLPSALAHRRRTSLNFSALVSDACSGGFLASFPSSAPDDLLALLPWWSTMAALVFLLHLVWPIAFSVLSGSC